MFTLDQVVPWGRSFDEYRRMFALSDADLALNILGCGDGPASFNAEATRRGESVISCDPIYQFTTVELRGRIAATYDQILDQTRKNPDEFVWTAITSVEELGRVRMEAMRTFLDDFDAGKAEGRYVEGALPALPFTDKAFDLALCSHFLFLYTDQLGEDFHRSAITELCRVAREVRIFPLLALGGKPSPYVSLVSDQARAAGYDVVIERVPYEFQRGGNEVMRVGTHLTARVPVPATRVTEPIASAAAGKSKTAAVQRPEPARRSTRESSPDRGPKPKPAANTGAQEAAFYSQVTSSLFRALPATTGPWDRTLQHGGPPIALLGRALERLGGPAGSRIARIAFDFYSPVPVSLVSVETTILRPGRKLQISEATMRAAGRVVLRATAAHVLAEAGRSPAVDEPFVVPALPAAETRLVFPGVERFEYADAIEWRVADGDLGRPGPATVWTRCRMPIVRDSALTGLERVLAVVDAANGISAELPMSGWMFVPIDVMVTLLRMPEAEWLGMSSRTTIAADGIGATETVLFDAEGALGRALQTLYVAPRKAGDFV
jgi:SAM-dependent methyltransferase